MGAAAMIRFGITLALLRRHWKANADETDLFLLPPAAVREVYWRAYCASAER
jgi:hypothetical protein